jgi:hypothetical protein
VWDRQREGEGRRRAKVEGGRTKVEGRSKGQKGREEQRAEGKGGAKSKRIKGIHEERCCGILFDVPRYVSAIIPKKCAFSLQLFPKIYFSLQF